MAGSAILQPSQEAMNGNLETIATFNDLTQAQAARAALQAEGVASDLRDEAVGSLNWGLIPALGGLRLQVDSADVPRALDVLDDFNVEIQDHSALAANARSEPSDAEERSYQERSRRRKRLVALVYFLILFLPMLLSLLFGWFT